MTYEEANDALDRIMELEKFSSGHEKYGYIKSMLATIASRTPEAAAYIETRLKTVERGIQ